MTLAHIIICVTIISILIVYQKLAEKKKYQDTIYLSNLEEIPLFFDTIQRLDDYVTWVQRDQIKARFSAAGHYFKTNLNFTRKKKM